MTAGRSNDEGAALITVLTITAIMATLAIVIVDAAQFSVRRTSNQQDMEQARRYLMGAEEYARVRLREVVRSQRDNTQTRIDVSEWQGREWSYPLDEGFMTVRLYDGSNCFNLNSVTEQVEGGGLIVSTKGQVQLARIMDLSEAGARDGFSAIAALADYIDTDRVPQSGSVEDAPSMGEEGPFRAANTLLADVGELLNVRGFSPDIVARITPFVCARPTAASMQVNVNTLTTDQAPLLASHLGTSVTVNEARVLLASRPRGGWADVEEFLRSPQFAGVEMSDAYRAQFTTQSRWYVVTASVRHRDVEERSAVLVDVLGQTRIVRRVYGATVSERSV